MNSHTITTYFKPVRKESSLKNYTISGNTANAIVKSESPLEGSNSTIAEIVDAQVEGASMNASSVADRQASHIILPEKESPTTAQCSTLQMKSSEKNEKNSDDKSLPLKYDETSKR